MLSPSCYIGGRHRQQKQPPSSHVGKVEALEICVVARVCFARGGNEVENCLLDLQCRQVRALCGPAQTRLNDIDSGITLLMRDGVCTSKGRECGRLCRFPTTVADDMKAVRRERRLCEDPGRCSRGAGRDAAAVVVHHVLGEEREPGRYGVSQSVRALCLPKYHEPEQLWSLARSHNGQHSVRVLHLPVVPLCAGLCFKLVVVDSSHDFAFGWENFAGERLEADDRE
jgi:hypothetical protein